jgi:phosphatidylethanolamine/phosphatidyl-N-methylethanolamine N-methyltransferase
MDHDDRGRGYWERHARNYERSMVLLGKPIPRMVKLVAEAVAGSSNVLEVAAGTGIVTVALARAAQTVVATDYADAMVATLKARVRENELANVRCEQADLYALPFESSSFDAIVAANVLHLVPDLPGALTSLRRVLKPGGRLIAPTYCHDETPLSWVVSRVLAVTGFPGHRRFTTESLRQSLESAHLQVRRAETLPGLIPIGYVEATFSA